MDGCWIYFRYRTCDQVMETQAKKDKDFTLDIVTEFIEVLIHQVLHLRYNPLLYLYLVCKFVGHG